MRIDKHQYMFRSDIVKNVIQLVIRHHGIGGQPDQHPLAQPIGLPFCLIDKTLCLKH